MRMGELETFFLTLLDKKVDDTESSNQWISHFTRVVNSLPVFVHDQ
jgi:hypothetical protein